MTGQVLWMNIPLMLLAFALLVGVPCWLAQRPSIIRVRAYDGRSGLIAM
jgi:hypothetical protein